MVQMQTQKKRTSWQDIDGILLLDKPTDISSNAILQRVRRLYQARKAGHTGSLDPLATGMLPICFGEATKFSQFLLDADKCYVVEAELGVTTTTGDSQGDIINTVANVSIEEPELSKTVNSFVGRIQQVPPMYSALKHKGQPLYKYARSGVEIERKARQINIYSSDLLDFNGKHFRLRVKCSKGTYIRTLVEDIGAKLETGAHVTMLHREYTSGFATDEMYAYSKLQEMSASDLQSLLLPVDRAVQHLAKLTLSTEQSRDLFFGKLVELANYNATDDTLLRLYTTDTNKFIGIGEVQENTLKAKRLLSVNKGE